MLSDQSGPWIPLLPPRILLPLLYIIDESLLGAVSFCFGAHRNPGPPRHFESHHESRVPVQQELHHLWELKQPRRRWPARDPNPAVAPPEPDGDDEGAPDN